MLAAGLLTGGSLRTLAAAEPTAPVAAEAAKAKKPGAGPVDDAVHMEKMVVQEKAGAETAYSTKIGTESLTEVVSGARLNTPNAQSSGDLLKDVSGVSVNKSGDGTSKVSVRGLDQRLLRITVDGQRQGGTGNALDNIPPEIVQSMEVTKAFTPDMEADAVGGVINVNTGGTVAKEGYWQTRDQITYNSTEPRPGMRVSVTRAEPFRFFSSGERNASVVATGTIEDQYRRSERLSVLRQWPLLSSPGPAPWTSQSIPALTQPLIDSTLEHRQRVGAVVNADARLGPTAVFWRTNFNHSDSKRDRDLNDSNPAAGTPVALTPTSGVFTGVIQSRRNQRSESRRDGANLSLGGKNETGQTTTDLTIGYALTREADPHSLETVFLSDHTYRSSYDFSGDAFSPVFAVVDESNAADTASVNDPARYRFNYLSVSRTETKDEEASAKLNVKMDLAAGGRSGSYLKFGAKAQQRHRSADSDREVFRPAGQSLTMTGLVGAPMRTLDTMSYRFGPVPDAGAVADARSRTPGAFQPDATQSAINSGSGDYTVTETVGALYGMGKAVFRRWTLLGGVRLEGTRVTAAANQMRFDSAGNFLGFNRAHSQERYLEALPSLHVRYEPSGGLLFRSSVTRSMSRPNYSDIAPFRSLSFVDRRSRVGNPQLGPYQATNFDWSVDRYSDQAGLVSLSLFYKKIDHFIADTQYVIVVGNLGEFTEFKRVNGDTALAMGAEANWQSPTWTLRHGWGQASVIFNYSYTHGEAHYPNRPGETFPLPDQAIYQGGLTAHWERGGLTLEGSVRYKSNLWEDLIAPGFDNYLLGAWDAEVSGSYKLTKSAKLTWGAANALNRPTRHYAGTTRHMNDYQVNGVDFNLGLQWKH